jgi:hypothetical protein
MEMSGQLHVPAALLQAKTSRYPLDRKLDGPQRRSGRCGEEKNLLHLPGIEPRCLSRQARSPLLYRMSYPGSTYNITVVKKL